MPSHCNDPIQTDLSSGCSQWFAACRCQDQHPALDFKAVALCQAVLNQSPSSVSALTSTDIVDKAWEVSLCFKLWPFDRPLQVWGNLEGLSASLGRPEGGKPGVQGLHATVVWRHVEVMQRSSPLPGHHLVVLHCTSPLVPCKKGVHQHNPSKAISTFSRIREALSRYQWVGRHLKICTFPSTLSPLGQRLLWSVLADRVWSCLSRTYWGREAVLELEYEVWWCSSACLVSLLMEVLRVYWHTSTKAQWKCFSWHI